MNWEPALVGLVVGLPSFALAYLAYHRSRQVDRVSAQSGAASDNRAGTTQVIEALNGLINQIQEDNRELRDELRQLDQRLQAVYLERDKLKREIARLRKRYDDDDTPPHGQGTTR